MRATVRATPWALAARHAMMFASSELLAAISRSDFRIPASESSLGLAPLPWITRTSSCSVARSTSASLCSMRTTSWPSCESNLAVLYPTSPAPMITVRTPLLPPPRMEEIGPVQVLFGPSNHDNVSLAQHGVRPRDGPRLTLGLDGQDRQAALPREVQVGQALALPLPRNLSLDQGFLFAEVDVVHNAGGSHSAGNLSPHVLLRFDDPVGPDPFEYAGVKLCAGASYDEGHSHLLKVRCRQNASLHVFPDHHSRAVELTDVEVAQNQFVSGVRGDEVRLGVLAGEILDQVLVCVDP